MANCCIRGCNSNSRANDEGLSFFRFPRTEALQKLWKDNIGTENIKPYKAVTVCSKHFEDTCINRTLEVVRLKDDVVPTIFPFPSSSRCSSSSGKHRGALAMNIAGNTTALLPVKMADDIDIEEHDVLDNPRIKNIFADITCITKTDVMKYEDEGINDFDEESYETYQQDLTDPEILERSVVLEDCGDSLKYNPYFCSDCEILFPTENALNSHKMTAHSFLAAVGRNKAIKSTAKSSIVARLKFETDSNTEISNLCNHCNKVFPDEISFLKHYEELLTRKFSCDDCDVEFESEMSLQQHSRTRPGVLMYCCPICFCYFKLSNKILSHMVDQHQVDIKEVPQRVETTYKCRFCPKILKDIKSYNIHIQCLHPDLYKKIVKDKTHTDKFKSQSSNLTFPSKSCIGSKAERLKLETDLNMELSNLYNYCNQVFPDEKSRRMFSCTVCNLAFDSKISLGQHLRTRFNCLLYCCPICSCYYKFMNKIVSHMVDQHQIDVKKEPKAEKATYKCRFCAKTFTDNRSYNYHIKNMHCEQYYKKSTKFECQPYCNLTFLSADSEKIHRVSQHAIEAQIYSTSIDLDEQIEIEPLSPKISHRLSQPVLKTYLKSIGLDEQIKIEPLSPTISHRLSQPVLKTYLKSIGLDEQIKIEPLSPTISHRLSQPVLKTYSKSISLDKQIKKEPLSHRVSQHEIEAEIYSTSIDLDEQIKIEPLSPTISHRLSQPVLKTYSKSISLDKQIKIEPLSHRVSQHEIEAETSSKSVDLDKQIKIEPLSPTIIHRVSQHEIEAETSSKSVDLDKQIKIEPLSPTIIHRVSQHEIEAETSSKSVDLDKQIKIEPLSPTITHRVSQHAIESETSSKSVDLDKQIKIEPLSPTIIHRVSQHEIEAETSSKSVDLDKQIKIEPLSPTISHRVSQHEIEAETSSKSVDLDKQIKIEPLSPKITQTVLKQKFIWRPVPKSTLFKCSKCQIHFVSSLVALEHTKRCALKKGNWKCKTCRIPFRLVDRHVHTIQHDWTDRFKILTVHENMLNSILCRCVSCKVCSDERTLMRSHERGCPKSISFLCNMCNVNINEKVLTEHIKVHNEMDSESFVVVDFVNVDQSTLSSAIVIKPTIKNVKSKKPAKELKELKFYYYCPTCRCYMKVKKLSDEHDSGKCKIHLKKRLCELCGLTFSPKCFVSHVQYHKKFPHLKLKDLTFVSTESGKKVNPPPPYFTKCVNCEVKFYRTLALNNHDCIGDEPKTCGYCGDIFSDFAYKLHVPFHEYAVERNTVIENERMSNNPDKERAPKVTHRVSQQIEIESKTYSKTVDLNKQIKIEPPSPTISRRVPQHAIKTYSKSVNLDKQINIEPLSPTIIHRVSQDEIEAETSWKSVDLDKQIKIEPLSPTITHRVSQHAIEAETYSTSVNQDKQIKIEPLSPTISHRVSQHEIEAETSSKSVDLDKQIKIEPPSPTISRRLSRPVIKTYSKSVNLNKQIKIEPLSPKITQTDLKQELR